MNIVILCLQNGGFGDLLFAQKFAFELNGYFRQNELDVNVSIVALPESINDMKKLGLMEEFKIPVATPHDIYEKTQDSSAKFEIGYMIVAPSFTSKEKFDWDGKDMFGMNGYATLDSRGNLHQSGLENRTLYIPEYNSEGAAAAGLHAQFFENTKTEPKIQRTGLSSRAGNAGLLISNDITQATLSSEADPAYENKSESSTWGIIHGSKIGDKLPKDFYLEYSSNYKNSSTKRYLEIVLSLSEEKQNNHVDVLCIGDRGKKYDALQNIKDKIIAKGYSRIEFVNMDTDEHETIYQRDGQENEKIYRVFFMEKVPHKIMVALLQVSDQFIGVTGDQSLSEAISKLDKVVFYERLMHKVKLYENYQDFVYNICSPDMQPKIKEFLEKINNYEQDTDLESLAKMVLDKGIRQTLKSAHQEMAVNCNLVNQVGQQLMIELRDRLAPLEHNNQSTLTFEQKLPPKKPTAVEKQTEKSIEPARESNQAVILIRQQITTIAKAEALKVRNAIEKLENATKNASPTKTLDDTKKEATQAFIGLYSAFSSAREIDQDHSVAGWVRGMGNIYLETVNIVANGIFEACRASNKTITDVESTALSDSVMKLIQAGSTEQTKSVQENLSTMLNILPNPGKGPNLQWTKGNQAKKSDEPAPSEAQSREDSPAKSTDNSFPL